jgi:hypothetical protein
MKVQYFGDINDYRKFALLRLFAIEGILRTGICWMLTENDERADGNKRTYIRQPAKWRSFDAKLFDALSAVPIIPTMTDLEKIEREALIPNATFYHAITPDARAARELFHKRCRLAFAETDLAFFDPDNGLDVASCPKGRKNSSKYVFIDELADHFADGRSIVFYQHYPREPRGAFLAKIVGRLEAALPEATVWSFHTSHVAFVLAARPEHFRALQHTVGLIKANWPAWFIEAAVCARRVASPQDVGVQSAATEASR